MDCYYSDNDNICFSDMKHPFHDKDAGVGVSDLLLPTSNPGRSVSLQQSPGTMADPSQSVGTEACSLHNQLSAEQVNCPVPAKHFSQYCAVSL